MRGRKCWIDKGLGIRLNGFQDRRSESVSDDGTTTYDDPDPALTDLLTYFSRKWPEMTPNDKDRVFAICLGCDDPDLRTVAEAWPELPEAVRAGIVAMIGAVSGGA